jgi:hypothetical protein
VDQLLVLLLILALVLLCLVYIILLARDVVVVVVVVLRLAPMKMMRAEATTMKMMRATAATTVGMRHKNGQEKSEELDNKMLQQMRRFIGIISKIIPTGRRKKGLVGLIRLLVALS